MNDLAARPRHHDDIVVPKPVVRLTIALVVFAITTTAAARWWQIGVTHDRTIAPKREATFRVTQSFHGPVTAYEAGGRVIRIAADHEEKFPRLILRSVATLRERDGVSPDAPLKLIEASDGERMLIDPATGRQLRLAAFGPENQESLDMLFIGPAK